MCVNLVGVLLYSAGRLVSIVPLLGCVDSSFFLQYGDMSLLDVILYGAFVVVLGLFMW